MRRGDKFEGDGLYLARLGHACDVAMLMGPADVSFGNLDDEVRDCEREVTAA